MSLVGNLEDLGLGEILQIVSLSRKSGVLVLESGTKNGTVVFRDGNVVQASSNSYRENLGSVLVQKDMVDVDRLKEALLKQKDEGGDRKLGQILIEDFGLSADNIETAVKEQVEKIVYNFFGWIEGQFSFELGDQAGGVTNLDPLVLMLDGGLSPQWLAMEGSRLIDERRHRGEEIEDELKEPVVDLQSILGDDAEAFQTETQSDEVEETVDGHEDAPVHKIVLIDDDEQTRLALGDILRESGASVELHEDATSLLLGLDDDCEDTVLLLIVDMIMPKMDGSGILGGVELTEIIREKFPALQIAVISDHPNPDAESRLAELNVVAVLEKPSKSVVHDGGAEQELSSLAGSLLQFIKKENLPEGSNTPAANMFNLGTELRKEFGEDEPSKLKGPESPGLHLLRGMLQELQNPSLGGGIILIVLRFASELMNRAVIFAVKDETILGIGQFGIELPSGEPADQSIRKMKIPYGEGSLFDEVISGMNPVKTTLGSNSWDKYISEQLGSSKTDEVFVGPILSEGKVVAVIYGDNNPENCPIGETESFEVFLSQAGFAMEKALLERRLQTSKA